MVRAAVVTLGLLTVALGAASAQERMARTREGSDAPVNRPIIPRAAKYPFQGTWVGTETLPEHTIPIMFEFESAKGRYAGRTVWPNGGVAPHSNTKVTGDALLWQMPNSGGGTWLYQLKRAAADSLVGTVELRDWPQGPPVSGTLVLVRKAAEARTNR